MTLGAQYVPNDGGREYVLLKYDNLDRARQRIIEAWRTARVAVLLAEFGVENVMAWHGAETREAAWDVLLDYADYTLSEVVIVEMRWHIRIAFLNHYA